MAPRAFWTGNLRLSLVTIPVRLYPATSSERKIEFHQIHEPTGKRIRYQKVAPGVGPVENEEIIKGYEYEKGKYVLLDQKEIDKLKLESKQTIELVRFVDPGRHRPALFREALLPPARRRGRRGRLCHHPEGAGAGRQGRCRPTGAAGPEQHRGADALRARACARSSAPGRRTEIGRRLLQGRAGGEGRQGGARPRQGADRAQGRCLRAGEIQGRIHRGGVGADQRQDRAPRAGAGCRGAGQRQGDQHHGRAQEEREARQGRSRKGSREVGQVARRQARGGVALQARPRRQSRTAPKRKSA